MQRRAHSVRAREYPIDDHYPWHSYTPSTMTEGGARDAFSGKDCSPEGSPCETLKENGESTPSEVAEVVSLAPTTEHAVKATAATDHLSPSREPVPAIKADRDIKLGMKRTREIEPMDHSGTRWSHAHK